MHYSALTQRITGEGADAWNIHYRALARQARGEDITVLSVGDPDFDTPTAIVDSAVASLRSGATHYTHMQGKLRLRELIAQRHREQSGQAVTAVNVAVMAGAQCALFAVAQCILDPGDEVIVPEPMYVTYEAALRASDATLVPVPLRPENDFALRVDEITAAVTPRTRALLINSPHNPTGRMLSRQQWDDIARLCCEHDLWLMSDEVYAQLAFEEAHVFPAALPGMAKRTATLNSLSKSHAMTGWRLGWAIGPEALIEHLGRLALCMLYGSPGFIQDAAYTALSSPSAGVTNMRDNYRRRRDAVCDALSDSPQLKVVAPAAGMFLMIDIRGTGLSAQAFADKLLDEYAVSVLAGEAFGPSAAGFIRVSLTVDSQRLSVACRRIQACAEQSLAGNTYAVR